MSAASEALSLDKRTQLDQRGNLDAYDGFSPPVYLLRCVVLRDYGSGIVEVGYTTCPAIDERIKPDEVQESQDLPFDTQQSRARQSQNLKRSLRRSKAQFRRKCLAGGLDYMLTLTYRANQTDLSQGWKDFARFVRLVRKTNPNWKYCAVPEYQKRGAVHFHVAVQGFQNVRLLRSCWLSVIGDGNVDVKRPKTKVDGLWSRIALASYLTKYLTKELITDPCKQRYRVSEGIIIPKQRTIQRFPKGFDIVQAVFDSLGVSIGFRWDGDNHAHGWACSWT